MRGFISGLRENGRNGIKLTSCLILLASLSAHAEQGAVKVELQGSAPTDNVLSSFEGQDEDGMGWFRDASEWKDVGFSFVSHTDGHFRKVILRLQALHADFREETKFHLEIYENNSGKEYPLDGKKVYSGEGRFAIERSDVGMYLSFELGQEVPLVSGNAYTVMLIWDEPAPVVVLQANINYTEGFSWYRNETTDGKFLPNNSSDRPSLTFHIQ